MKLETIIWTLLLVIVAGYVVVRTVAVDSGFPGRIYTRMVEVNADDPDPDLRWSRYDSTTYADYAAAQAADPSQTVVQFSFMRTFGIWLAASWRLRHTAARARTAAA